MAQMIALHSIWPHCFPFQRPASIQINHSGSGTEEEEEGEKVEDWTSMSEIVF